MENKTEKEKAPGKGEFSAKTKKIILVVIASVILTALCVGGFFFWDLNTYYNTQNAKVTASLFDITPASTGRLTGWTVREGDMVTENEVIGRVENFAYLRSPVSGRVVRSSAALNQFVSQAAAIGVIADTSNMYILANIEETAITKVREGQSVSVRLDVFPGITFQGYVTEIDMLTQDALSGGFNLTTSGTFSKTTKLIPVKIRLNDNIDLSLFLGTNASIRIRLR